MISTIIILENKSYVHICCCFMLNQIKMRHFWRRFSAWLFVGFVHFFISLSWFRHYVTVILVMLPCFTVTSSILTIILVKLRLLQEYKTHISTSILSKLTIKNIYLKNWIGTEYFSLYRTPKYILTLQSHIESKLQQIITCLHIEIISMSIIKSMWINIKMHSQNCILEMLLWCIILLMYFLFI